MIQRRQLLRHGLALAPLAAGLLAACGDDTAAGWPEGMLPITWDRDTCVRCKMAISDRRFAAQVRGGPRNEAFKFDDIGCASTWCAEKHKLMPWIGEPGTRFWVADAASAGTRWLDARRAHYVAGARSPMGYDFSAQPQPSPGSLDFDAMSRKVIETWPADCKPGEAAGRAASSATGASS